ncbi:hypothetical protein Tco_1400537 [Tanacetum coccineum]
MKAPKRSKRQKTNSNHKEENQLRTFLKIVPEEEEKIDYDVLGTRYPIINWESKYYDYGHFGRELIYYKVFRADGSLRWIKTFSEMIKFFDRMDLGDLRIMFESKEDDELSKNQEEWKLQSWIFYENCRVYVLRLEDGTEINMLVERRYPLTKNTLERMMDLRLTSVSDDDTVFDLLVQKQTAFGKDKSNPLIVDSLLKTIRLSIHLVVYNEELAILEQTATGKGISNPLMAGSLPKTTKPT